MLRAMQLQASPAPSPASSTFAGLLAALSARPSAAAHRPDDGLADDVATLSYERALRAHARYRAPDLSDRTLTQPADAGSVRIFEALPANADSPAATATAQAAPSSSASADPEATPDISTGPDRNLKCASITIRLSKAECAQLRQRAAEAGLTVSAYMRSCTFEAESLRALVRGTLAQLRNEPGKESRDATPAARGSWLGRLRRFWPHPRAGQPLAQA